jgi:hypothetical protein
MVDSLKYFISYKLQNNTMKNKLILFTALLLMVICFGCEKKNVATPLGKMQAIINGMPFYGANCTAVGPTQSQLTIVGSPTSNNYVPGIFLTINNYTGVGTYQIESVADTLANMAQIDSSSSAIQAVSGTITVTAASATQFSGTFSFTAANGTQVTNGSFTATK